MTSPENKNSDKAKTTTADLVRTIEQQIAFQRRLTELIAAKRDADLFDVACSIIRDHMDVPFFQVIAHEMGSESFTTLFTKGEPVDLLKAGILKKDLIDWVFETVEISIVRKRDPWLNDDNVRSLILAPLPGKSGPLGIAILGTSMDEEAFSTFYANLLRTLCRQVAFVLEGIKLTEHTLHLGNLLDNILESVPHAVIATAADDRILAANKNAEFMFGFRRIMAEGERYQDVLPQKISETMSSIVLRTLTGEKTVDHQIDYELPDGAPITLGISASLLYDNEFAPRGVVFLCRDMTLSLEVQKLRELDQLKSEFVQMVSHELKTPLTTILGGCEIMAMDADQLNAEQNEVLEIISSGADRLKDLITDLLDLSRIESGDKIELQIERVDIQELLNASIEVARGKGRHTFELDVEGEMPPLFLDVEKMKQVFDNVLGNAVKYSPDGGNITVKVTLSGPEVYVAVSDEGLGIGEDHLPYIFDKFYRAISLIGIEGTGLGLPIAKHIMELHGGDITVESKMDKGSTFTIVIPTRKS